VIAQLFFGLLLFATVLGHVANIVTSVSAGRKEFQGESGSNSSRPPMAPRLPPSLPSRDGTLPAARRNCDRPSISLSLSISVCLRVCGMSIARSRLGPEAEAKRGIPTRLEEAEFDEPRDSRASCA